MRSAGRTISTAVAAIALALAVPTAERASAATLEEKTFTWKRPMYAGDCEISSGATWTLYANGTARLDATVFSVDGDDAWLMWARLLDADRAVLGEIRVAGSSSTKFVKNLPVQFRRYRWLASGRFDSDLFDLVEYVSLSKHC
ncbi:DUF6294 family protein [Nonomuraea sp. NPDC050451]|uniref:DUF6294 family protein n=1 Tax=Nonomuraea sp. NPDC050451 TaxID=3364364 RepID=UPI0037936421